MGGVCYMEINAESRKSARGGGSGLDFLLRSFEYNTVHSTGQTDRPNLGGAPSRFPTVGKAKP
jgi:hypothetical protein